MTEIIYFNGKAYNSLSEMPPDVRENYERAQQLAAILNKDQNQDGVPDIVQPRSLADLKGIFKLAQELQDLQGADSIHKTATGKIEAGRAVIRQTSEGIFVNGEFYESPEDMPQDVYEIYDAAINAQAEIADAVSGEARQVAASPEIIPSPDKSHPPLQTIDTTQRFLLWLALGLLFLCIAASIFWMLLS